MKNLVLALVSVLACTAGCVVSNRVVRDDNPLVTIPAGAAEWANGYVRANYVIDRTTQTCWMMFVGGSTVELECCKLSLAPEAAPYLTWVDARTCEAAPAVAPAAPAE